VLASSLLALSIFVAPPALSEPVTGADVVRLMHARYAGTWYRHATFVQTTTFADGRQETWYEAMSLPGTLRIDVAPLSAGKVILFRNDSIYQYAGGELRPGRPLVHPLLLLGFDVYGQPAEKSIAALEQLGYDLSKLSPGTWQGRKVWIVGAASGDSTSKQFWIDQERLVFVRSLGPTPQKPGVRSEVQFNKYVPLGQGWIETEVLFLEDGKVTLTEAYRDVRAEPVPSVDPRIFLPGLYVPPGWVKE
jgi:hypothetical protein